MSTRSGDTYKPSALRGYQAALRQRILPAFGAARLSEIKRVDLQDLVETLLSETPALGSASGEARGGWTRIKHPHARAVAKSPPFRDARTSQN